MSRSNAKLKDWMRRVDDSLSMGRVGELPAGCKYLRYWHKKVGSEAPEEYIAFEEPVKRLLRESALRMLEDSEACLREARRHGKHTKVRLTSVMRFVYTYQRYIHPLLVKSRESQVAYSSGHEFIDEFLEELVVDAEKMSLFQAGSMLRYLNCCKGVGLVFRPEYLTVFQDVVSGFDEEKPNTGDYWLDIAEANISRGRFIQAVALAGEALRTFVDFMCTFYGSETRGDYYDSETSFEDRPFVHWLSFLRDEGVLSSEEVLEYGLFNSVCFEAIGREGYLPPDEESLRRSVSSLRGFMRRNWNKMTSPEENQ